MADHGGWALTGVISFPLFCLKLDVLVYCCRFVLFISGHLSEPPTCLTLTPPIRSFCTDTGSKSLAPVGGPERRGGRRAERLLDPRLNAHATSTSISMINHMIMCISMCIIIIIISSSSSSSSGSSILRGRLSRRLRPQQSDDRRTMATATATAMLLHEYTMIYNCKCY